MINIPIDDQMKSLCINFAREIIQSNNQYNRLPVDINARMERTFVGKLAELAFLHFLHQRGVEYPIGDMFEIYTGQQNVDSFDFLTKDNRSIDIKCASKPYHRRIMVPIDQFRYIPKDFYVGIKLNGRMNNNFIDVQSITTATIYGFCDYKFLGRQETNDFGEFECKSLNLADLYPIEELLELM